MPDRFGIFVLASLVLVAIPGPDVFYITARGFDQGRRAALVSVLSAAIGGLVLTIGVAVGLATVLESMPFASVVAKYLGAAYLVYLGLRRMLAGRVAVSSEQTPPRAPQRRIFIQGFVIALSNPKTALFFLAILPQFVNPVAGSIWLQLVVFGVTFVTIGLCTDSCYALLSGTFGNWLRKTPTAERPAHHGASGSGGLVDALRAKIELLGSPQLGSSWCLLPPSGSTSSVSARPANAIKSKRLEFAFLSRSSKPRR